MMPRFLTRFFAAAAVALIAAKLAYDVTDPSNGFAQSFFTDWYQAFVFCACGLAALTRVAFVRRDRLPWALLGVGLTLYAAASVYYGLEARDGVPPAFPSLADALWLSLYPLGFAAIALLVRQRFRHVGAGVWLDAAICGTTV